MLTHTYNKLVRDNIPEFLKEKGMTVKSRKLRVTEYKKALFVKLLEESQKVVEAKNKEELIKELADVQEVLNAIYLTHKIECSDVTKTARKKRKERGAFEKRVFLETVKE